MATTSFFRYHCLGLDLGLKKHDLSADQLVFTLHTDSYIPSLSGDAVFADVDPGSTELPTGGGYTNGGINIPLTSFGQTGGNADLIVENVLFTATAAIPAWQYVVIRNIDAVGEPLIGYGDYGAPVTIANGETFAFNFNFLARLLRISVVA